MRRHRAGYRKHEAGIRSLALALGLTLAVPALAAEGGAKIGQPPLLGTLSGAWWQWALSIPANANPLTDPTGERCGVGQHGPVWFLGGGVNISSLVRRTCTIPAGTAILIPAINGECSTIEGDGTTKSALRACAIDQMNGVTSASATVDGHEVRPVRAQAGLFSFTLPPGNVLGIAPSTEPNPSPAVADGFWVLVRPLPVGKHTIHVEGTAVVDGSTFSQDVTYTIEVVSMSLPPRRR